MSKPTIRPARHLPLLLAAAGALSWAAPMRAQDGPKDPDPSRFADRIRMFDEADREDRPMSGGVVFVGSSSIARWNLGRSFPSLSPLNRGLGGPQLSDVIAHAGRLIAPYHPRVVVLYAGDNDIASGKSAERVRDDFLEVAGIVRESAPEALLLYLSIKPSPSRSDFRPEMARANDLIALACEADDRLEFVDVASPMLGPDDELRPELYAHDLLHLSDEGYAIWVDALRPVLGRAVSGERH